jgi:K+:H+ antiporter
MRPKTALLYSAMLVAAVGVFLWIRSVGESLVAPDRLQLGQYATNAPTTAVTSFTHVLLALVVIILAARGLGYVFRRFNQPPVVGEMVAGILLGPSRHTRAEMCYNSYIDYKGGDCAKNSSHGR